MSHRGSIDHNVLDYVAHLAPASVTSIVLMLHADLRCN